MELDVAKILYNHGLCRSIKADCEEFDTNIQIDFWFVKGNTKYSLHKLYDNYELDWGAIINQVYNDFMNGRCNVRFNYAKQETKNESTGSKETPVKSEGREAESRTGEAKHTAAEEKADEKG